PAAQAAILKKAFMDTQSDPEYLREAKQLALDVSPRSGDEIQTTLQRLGRTPPALIPRYKEILGSKERETAHCQSVDRFVETGHALDSLERRMSFSENRFPLFRDMR